MSKKLLYIGNKPSRSTGTVTTIETLSLLLASEGFEVVTASAAKNKAHRLLDMIITTFRQRKKVDFVLIDTYSTLNFAYAVAVAKLCRKYKVPYIPILHGGDLPNRLIRSPKLAKNLFGKAHVNVSPSHYLTEAFNKAGFDNVIYIPNTIEISNYPFLLRKEIKPKLLWVRSFSEVYNPMLALKVLQELLPKYPNATLCMVGPEKDGTLSLCKQFSQKEQLAVTFTGRLEKQAWIELSAQYDIFLNTTNFDNMPVSVVEAMALGLPIISTNVGGIPFLVEDRVNGLLVSPNDVKGFIQAIDEVIKQPEEAVLRTESARKKANTFDWENVKHKWLTLLNH